MKRILALFFLAVGVAQAIPVKCGYVFEKVPKTMECRCIISEPIEKLRDLAMSCGDGEYVSYSREMFYEEKWTSGRMKFCELLPDFRTWSCEEYDVKNDWKPTYTSKDNTALREMLEEFFEEKDLNYMFGL